MRFYLKEEIFQQSPVLLSVLEDFVQKGYITLDKDEKNSARGISFRKNEKDAHQELVFGSILLENEENKLIDDMFQNAFKNLTDEKYIQALKELYEAFITAGMLNQKYNTQVSFDSFKQNLKDKNKENKKFCDLVEEYIQKKRDHLVKAASSLKILKENLSTKELLKKVEEIKLRKKLLKAQIVGEEIKIENALDEATKRMNLLQKSINLIVDIKCTQEIDNDNVDLIYQENIFKNLRLFRDYIEKKIMSEIYTRDQVEAFRVIKDLLEKKLLYAENDRQYITEKLEKQKKNPDPKLGELLAEIAELNRLTKRKKESFIG
jgi:hypothetical protein